MNHLFMGAGAGAAAAWLLGPIRKGPDTQTESSSTHRTETGRDRRAEKEPSLMSRFSDTIFTGRDETWVGEAVPDVPKAEATELGGDLELLHDPGPAASRTSASPLSKEVPCHLEVASPFGTGTASG